jgi:hypothetical protein
VSSITSDYNRAGTIYALEVEKEGTRSDRSGDYKGGRDDVRAGSERRDEVSYYNEGGDDVQPGGVVAAVRF